MDRPALQPSLTSLEDFEAILADASDDERRDRPHVRTIPRGETDRSHRIAGGADARLTLPDFDLPFAAIYADVLG